MPLTFICLYTIIVLMVIQVNEFEIINNTKTNIMELEELEKFINYSLDYLKINKEYRNKDSVTDVISFALEDDKTFINTEYRVLGDIYICGERCKNQAIEYGHEFKRELFFLTIHGLLHLLGYDHMIKEDEIIMFDLQKEILDSYGIKR